MSRFSLQSGHATVAAERERLSPTRTWLEQRLRYEQLQLAVVRGSSVSTGARARGLAGVADDFLTRPSLGAVRVRCASRHSASRNSAPVASPRGARPRFPAPPRRCRRPAGGITLAQPWPRPRRAAVRALSSSLALHPAPHRSVHACRSSSAWARSAFARGRWPRSPRSPRRACGGEVAEPRLGLGERAPRGLQREAGVVGVHRGSVAPALHLVAAAHASVAMRLTAMGATNSVSPSRTRSAWCPHRRKDTANSAKPHSQSDHPILLE